MAGHTLTKAATMLCPHGGQVQAVPSNTRAKGDDYLLTQADTFTIAGCAFTIPPGSPSPCLTVQWVVADTRVTAGAPTLSESDTGLCMNGLGAPQGPVSVVVTQLRVTTQ